MLTIYFKKLSLIVFIQ